MRLNLLLICVCGWSGPSALRNIWYALVAISFVCTWFPCLWYTTARFWYEVATSGWSDPNTRVLISRPFCMWTSAFSKSPFPVYTAPMLINDAATCVSLGVQFEWLDVTGMYPKYDRRVQISSLYSEEQRVCICFLLCSQSLWLFRERVVST